MRDVIDDDAAINGCRPVFVTVNGRTLLATADYGDCHPEIRLYDLRPAARHQGTPLEIMPGVVVHRVLVRTVQPESPLGPRIRVSD